MLHVFTHHLVWCHDRLLIVPKCQVPIHKIYPNKISDLANCHLQAFLQCHRGVVSILHNVSMFFLWFHNEHYQIFKVVPN